VALDNGKYAFKADSGNYMSRMNNGCRAAYPDTGFVHCNNCDGPWSQFTVEKLDNGKYTLLSDNGNYVSRCNNGIYDATYEDHVFMHVTKEDFAKGAPWSQWEIIDVEKKEEDPNRGYTMETAGWINR